MKVFYIALFFIAHSFLIQSQTTESPVQLKQINIVKTNFRNLKSGEIINKTILFKDGKIVSIKTSDVKQSFFYNEKGLLDMTVKDKEGSNWKEVINYSYNKQDQIVKFIKKYEEGGELVTKTVLIAYDGSRVRATSKKSNIQQTFIEDIEYIVENGIVIRRSSRDRNQQIINKIEYVYYKDNITRHKGLIGDKTIRNFIFDDKNSVELLIAQNTFGPQYKVIVPVISFHEEEFDLESISNNNEVSFNSTSTQDIATNRKYKYNALNYPISCSIIEDNGIVKTEIAYLYE